MVKFLKKGKVVIVLAGRYAGRKAVIAQAYEQGTKKRPYSHVLVAGIDKYPAKVTNTMTKKKVYQRSKIKPFVKTVNVTHLLPTRYSFEGELPKNLTNTDPATRKKAKSQVKRVFQSKHAEGKQKWFFSKLRF